MKYVIRYVKPHIPTMIFGFTIKFTGTIPVSYTHLTLPTT